MLHAAPGFGRRAVSGPSKSCADTGKLVAARISAIRSAARECVQLGFGHSELIATSDHPLYCPQTREWAPAGDWALGKRTMLLHVDEKGAAAVELHRVSMFAGVHQVFDLTVDHPLHNFVANDVLVHNKSAPLECESETVDLRAESTCGPSATLTLTSAQCEVTAVGAGLAGLPSQGSVELRSLKSGFNLSYDLDGGANLYCTARPNDAGFALNCTQRTCANRDGGCGCTGTLTPQ